MLLILAFFTGAIVGWIRASRRRLGLGDRVHHSAVFAIVFLIVTIFVTSVFSWQFD